MTRIALLTRKTFLNHIDDHNARFCWADGAEKTSS